MNSPGSDTCGLIHWTVAAQPLAGEVESGDLHFVQQVPDGVVLAVMDGIGHGNEATTAARTAVAVLEKHAAEPIISLMNRCHLFLGNTRGVVMSIARFKAAEGTVTWLGVGNVEGRLIRATDNGSISSETMLLRGGVVGYQLPPLQANILPVAPGDVLILATDGIRSEFADHVRRRESPEQIAQRIMMQHFKGTDDALVLVARYLGAPHE